MKGIWTWFRGLPTWGQVVGWVVGAIVVLGVLGAAFGEDPDSDQATGSENVAQADQTETTETEDPEPAPAEDEGDEPEPPPEETEPEPEPNEPEGDPEVDENTRYFLNQMSSCQVAVGLVILQAQEGNATDLDLADTTTQARDTCDAVREQLLLADTDHFDDQAALGYHGIDRLKSGLNAMLAYIDNPRPSKLIEARDKIQEGDEAAAQAQREITQRRRVYNLKPYRP